MNQARGHAPVAMERHEWLTLETQGRSTPTRATMFDRPAPPFSTAVNIGTRHHIVGPGQARVASYALIFSPGRD